MTLEQALQLGIGGTLTVVLIKIILTFVLTFMKSKDSERGLLSKSLIGVQNDIAGLTTQIKIQQDREQRFFDREWPQMAQSLQNFDRRISHLEKDVSAIKVVVRTAIPHSNLTPPMGVSQSISLLPIEDEDEDDS